MLTARWRRALRQVDPALVSPLICVPVHIKGPWTLKLIRRVNNTASRLRQGVTATTRSLPDGVRVVVHEPERRKHDSGALLWLHGGGLISGSAKNANSWASGFAADLGVPVVVPDYRLAPEQPYPAAVDDCYSALNWMVTNATHLGIDRKRIAVGGESAGGGLAAALAQRAHDAGIALRLQVLVAPMLDDRTVLRAERDDTVAPVWTVPSNRYAWTSYLGHPPRAAEQRPYAVPARRHHLTGLAPAWIGVGTADLFYAEGVAYAGRLEEDGVPCETVTIAGAHHAAEMLKPDHPHIEHSRNNRLATLRRALSAHIT